MYIYDRELSGEPDLGIEQSPLNLPLGAYLHGFAQVTPTPSSPTTLAMRPRPDCQQLDLRQTCRLRKTRRAH